MMRNPRKAIPTLGIFALLALFTLMTPGLLLAQGGPPAEPPGGHGGHGFRQGPGDGPGILGHLGRLARALDLSEEQITATKTLVQAHREAVEPLREQQRAGREAVRELLDQTPQDATAIGQAVIAAHAVGEQIHAAFEQLMTDFRALLTQEQEERLDEILAMRGEREGHRGPGRRPGGPGRNG